MASLIWWLSYILRIHTPTLIGSSFELVAFDPAQEKRGKKLKDLMYMLVIYCCFSSVQTERKNHDFSSHVVVIRPNFYIINDAFSRFMAITIFLLEGSTPFYVPFYFLERNYNFFPFC